MDERTLAPPDIGGLVRALVYLFAESRRWNWTDRVCCLGRCPFGKAAALRVSGKKEVPAKEKIFQQCAGLN